MNLNPYCNLLLTKVVMIISLITYLFINYYILFKTNKNHSGIYYKYNLHLVHIIFPI